MPGKAYTYDDDSPRFKQAMAAAFFDLSPWALKAKEADGYFLNADGTPFSITRINEHGDRKYSINDLQKIAHALRRFDKLTDRQFKLIILRIDSFREPIKKHRKRFRKGRVSEDSFHRSPWSR